MNIQQVIYNDKSCETQYKIDKLLEKSEEGIHINLACCNTDCEYIAKIQDIPDTQYEYYRKYKL